MSKAKGLPSTPQKPSGLSQTIQPAYASDLKSLQAETTAILGQFGSQKFTVTSKDDSNMATGMAAKTKKSKSIRRRKRKIKVSKSNMTVKKDSLDGTMLPQQTTYNPTSYNPTPNTVAWGNATVEVLDSTATALDTAYDTDEEEHNVMSTHAANERTREAETNARDLVFAGEETRVRASNDAFTKQGAGDGQSVQGLSSDLAMERARLDKIEGAVKNNEVSARGSGGETSERESSRSNHNEFTRQEPRITELLNPESHFPSPVVHLLPSHQPSLTLASLPFARRSAWPKRASPEKAGAAGWRTTYLPTSCSGCSAATSGGGSRT